MTDRKEFIYYVKHCVYKRKTTDADKNFNRAQGSWTKVMILLKQC